jgi:hypothetical protein
MIQLIDQILKVFADHGLFDEGVELIGSWCFHLYQKHLGAKPFPLRTQDIDFLIPNPFRGKFHKDFVESLEKIGFHRDFKNDGSLFLWNAELKIEFITPEKGRGVDEAITIKKLGVSAIPLRFVSLLLDDPITIMEQNIKINVPRPVNFCFHKLIIASRRRNAEKQLKDLQQSICTSVVIDRKELRKVFESLPKKWRIAVLKMLGKAKAELPLMAEEIADLEFVLQNKKAGKSSVNLSPGP